jgi:hypothetical protein
MKHTLQVTDSKGQALFQKEGASKGKFAFTTEDYDMFEVCFMTVAQGEDDISQLALYSYLTLCVRWD